MIAAHVDENVAAIIGRAHAEAIDAMTYDQLGQPHPKDGSKPTGDIIAAGGNMHVRPGTMDAHIGNGLGVLKDPVDPVGGIGGRLGFEYVTDALA